MTPLLSWRSLSSQILWKGGKATNRKKEVNCVITCIFLSCADVKLICDLLGSFFSPYIIIKPPDYLLALLTRKRAHGTHLRLVSLQPQWKLMSGAVKLPTKGFCNSIIHNLYDNGKLRQDSVSSLWWSDQSSPAAGTTPANTPRVVHQTGKGSREHGLCLTAWEPQALPLRAPPTLLSLYTDACDRNRPSGPASLSCSRNTLKM